MKKTRRMLIKSGVFGFIFIITMLVLARTTFPETIKALIDYKNDISETSIWDPKKQFWPIVVFRIGVYFIVPIVVSFFDISKSEKRNYGIRLLENLECQFFGYSFISAFYYVFGLDILCRADIFSIQDSVIFVCSAIATLIFDKKLVTQAHDNGTTDLGE